MIYEYENHMETSMQDLFSWMKKNGKKKGQWVVVKKWKGDKLIENKECQVK